MDEMARRRMAELLMDPFSQVPGGGSSANALQPVNPMVEDRRYYTDMDENAAVQAGIGFGGALGTLATAPPPFKLPAAAGMAAYGGVQQLRQILGEHMGRKLGYQGN